MASILRDRHTFIYFLYAEKANTIKIGITTNLKERFFRLQNACPEDLYLLKVIDGDAKEENRLHKMFRKYKAHSEWFTLNPELLDFIESLEWSKKFIR